MNDELNPDELNDAADTDETTEAPAAASIDLPQSEPLAAGDTGGIRAAVVAAETPFPIADSAHKAAFAVYNPTAAPLTVTGYVAEFVATVNGEDAVLDTDNSATHRDPMTGYTPVGNGMFLFFSGTAGLCIEPLYLAEMPVTVPAHHATTIHFYFHGLDIPASLEPFGIADEAGMAAHGARFCLRLRVELAEGEALTTEFPIAVID